MHSLGKLCYICKVIKTRFIMYYAYSRPYTDRDEPIRRTHGRLGALNVQFLAFETCEERDIARAKFWNTAGLQIELVDCSQEFVVRHMGADFSILPGGIVYESDAVVSNFSQN